MRLISAILTGVVAAFLALSASGAFARPEYARREGVACQYCHVSGSPGSADGLGGRQSTLRNDRGTYYGAHNHSFAGYVEKSGVSKVAPTFRYAWKEEFKTLPRRIAIGDVTGDGTPRLVTLSEKASDKNSATLDVLKWDGKSFVSEFTGEAKAAADRLAVGKFGGPDRPAVILTSDALWSWNGSTFVRRAAASPMPIIGAARMQDGTERVVLAPASNKLLAYSVNLNSVKQNDWLIDPIPAPGAPKSVWGDMHATPEFMTAMGVPQQLGDAGVYGLLYLKRPNVYYIYQLDRDTAITADPANPGKPKVVFTNTYFITFRETKTGDTLWTSPKLPGTGLDLVIDDPKNPGKQGLLVLFDGTTPVNAATPGKGRTIAFFAME
ncbi:MAG TPA: hypothetical protein VKT77_19015 [Chthonomonadaceae bacterium]|nr:hypothetical protein [Chthonomonadaceae bacterium]